MAASHPHPEFWTPIAGLLAALRAMLRAANPVAFAALASETAARLTALTAMVRRYIHIVAADVVLPPPRMLSAAGPPPASPGKAARARDYCFPLIETASHGGGQGQGEDAPGIQWALMLQAAGRLIAVMANPAPHARRLARCLARRGARSASSPLRDLAARWSVIRQLPPAIDMFLTELDQAARPLDWAGLDTS